MGAISDVSLLEKRLSELEGRLMELQHKLNLHEELLKAISQIGSSLSLSQVVTNVLDNVHSLLRAKCTALFLIERGTEELMLVGGRGIRVSFGDKLHYKCGEGIVGKAFESGTPIVAVGDEASGWLKGVYDELGASDWVVAMPLVIDEAAIGVLCVEGDDSARLSYNSVTPFIKLLAESAAAAVRNARLYEDLNARTAQLATLYEIGSALTSVLNLDRVLNLIVDSVTRLIGAEICSLMLLDPTKRYLRIRVAKGLPRSVVERTVIEVGEGISGWVAQHGQPLLIKDIESHPMFGKKSDSKYTTKSLLSVPLKVRGEVIGVLNVNNKVPRGVFVEEDANLLMLFATQAAIAIENAHLYQEVERLAITDGLTGLYEHRYFQEALENEIKRGLRYRHPTSLMMIDIDHFKRFNDSYGHQAGDEVLRRLAEIFKSQAREQDIVARYGGEEFAIILPVTPKEGALAAAARLRRAVELTTFNIRGMALHVTVSIGVASCPQDAQTREELISRADQALYAAKSGGRNAICYFDDKGQLQMLER
ncbi:MAG: sensor domain-containing diguanylate cyclase [Armatimonadota bacterium]|nr:sensor domain-containing diguanylate cyclase [Armatimonadota bacterium]MCX7778295.1 sensor domain-containing diguanylate cyclase [Armatimonadota bacterium]MDW8026317.1 sensor domain-containing diguanylate cyclase [Armatimonadota bacterium]